eukprot:g9131.t1
MENHGFASNNDPEHVEFVDFLRWFDSAKDHAAFAKVGFKMSHSAATLFGSSYVAPVGERVRNLSREQMKRSIVAYRQLYGNLRTWKANQAFRVLPADPMEEVRSLYTMISRELSTENEALFNLFAEHDVDLDGRLDRAEQAKMFKDFDKTATENEVNIYLKEVNADPVLQFLDFLDWWEQSKIVPQSLVSRKALANSLQMQLVSKGETFSTLGQNVIAKLGADAYLGNLFGHELRKKWAGLSIEDLLKVGESYKILYIDLRNYNLEHQIAQLESGICKDILI